MVSTGYVLGGVVICTVVILVGLIALSAAHDPLGIAACALLILVGFGGIADLARRVRGSRP